jgi:hypothetical protein
MKHWEPVETYVSENAPEDRRWIARTYMPDGSRELSPVIFMGETEAQVVAKAEAFELRREDAERKRRAAAEAAGERMRKRAKKPQPA